jgi:AAA domain
MAALSARERGLTPIEHCNSSSLWKNCNDAGPPCARTTSPAAKLSDPTAYFEAHRDELIVLDEVQRAPSLFTELRGVIDQRRHAGKRHGQFLLLGSATGALLQQSAESLAGRIA